LPDIETKCLVSIILFLPNGKKLKVLVYEYDSAYDVARKLVICLVNQKNLLNTDPDYTMYFQNSLQYFIEQRLHEANLANPA